MPVTGVSGAAHSIPTLMMSPACTRSMSRRAATARVTTSRSVTRPRTRRTASTIGTAPISCSRISAHTERTVVSGGTATTFAVITSLASGRPTSRRWDRSAAAQMPGLGLQEGADPVGRQGRPDARVLAPRPGEARADPIAAVPVDAAGVDAPEDPLGPGPVGRVHPRGEPVLGVVHQAHRLIVVGDHLQADDRAEALVAHHLHLMVHVGEHGGLEVPALALEAPSARQQAGAALADVGHLGVQHRQLLLAGERADVGGLVLGV